ncbi:MAG TPA: hypothetical protein VIJ33_05105 [Solirubrobacteraceae bacterium]
MAALVAAALALTGCGESSPKPLTRAELTAKANAICKAVTAKLPKKAAGSMQEIARLAGKLASSEQGALTELSKLVPPADLESDWKTFIADAEKLAENTAKLGEDAKSNNLKVAGPLISSSENLEQRMLAIAKRDGIKNCEQAP